LKRRTAKARKQSKEMDKNKNQGAFCPFFWLVIHTNIAYNEVVLN